MNCCDYRRVAPSNGLLPQTTLGLNNPYTFAARCDTFSPPTICTFRLLFSLHQPYFTFHGTSNNALCFNMSTDSDADNAKVEGFLRNWRQTAFDAGQFQTAIFVGDKLLAMTG